MKVGLLVALCTLSFFGCKTDRTIKVGLQPFNNFDQALTDSISSSLSKTYGVTIYILKSKNIPKEAFVNIKSPRYRADKLIALLKDHKPDSLDYILGMTREDISFTKKEAGKIKEPISKYEDWGIFGLGYRPGPTCIISTFRLKDKGTKVLMERLKKVAIHELGHNMGLDHCRDSKNCVMKDAAESIKTIDLADPELCTLCKRQISN